MSHIRKSLPNRITYSPEVFVLFTKSQKQHSTSVEALSSKEKLKHVGQALEAIHRESIQSGLRLRIQHKDLEPGSKISKTKLILPGSLLTPNCQSSQVRRNSAYLQELSPLPLLHLASF